MKNLPVFLLSTLLIISSIAQDTDDSDYQQLSDDEIQNDLLVQEILQYGLRDVYNRAHEKYGVSNETINITKVNSVYRQERRDEINFRCDIEGTNNYDANLFATLTIEYDKDSEDKRVRRWSYRIRYIEDSDYVELSDEEIQNSTLVNDILEYGLQYVYDKANERYGVSNDDIEITRINSVYRRQLRGQVNFRCDIEGTNNDDATINATFTIEYDMESEDKSVGRWSYSFRSISDNEDTEDDNEENEYIPEEETPVEEYVEEEAPVEEYVEEEQDLGGGDVPIETSYERVSPDEIRNSSEIRGVIEYGVIYVFRRANERYNISTRGIRITAVNSVYREELLSETNYRCDVQVVNGDDATVDARFLVRYEPMTDEKVMRRWWYFVNYTTTVEGSGNSLL